MARVDPVVAHAGGWDELLMVVTPVAAVWVYLKVRGPKEASPAQGKSRQPGTREER